MPPTELEVVWTSPEGLRRYVVVNGELYYEVCGSDWFRNSVSLLPGFRDFIIALCRDRGLRDKCAKQGMEGP